MKKVFVAMITFTILFSLLLPCGAVAQDVISPVESAIPTEPFTWEYLASIAGATVFTLLVAQFLKFPLDRVWKIPTRVLVYVIALAVMIVATGFTTGISVQTSLLSAVNAFIVALSAYGAYEITFKKMMKKTPPDASPAKQENP